MPLNNDKSRCDAYIQRVQIVIHDYAQLSRVDTPSYSNWSQRSINTHRSRPCELPTVNAKVLFFASETHKAQYALLIQTAYKNVKTTHVCARACGMNINVWTRSKVACFRCTYITVIVTWLSCDHWVAIFIAQRSVNSLHQSMENPDVSTVKASIYTQFWISRIGLVLRLWYAFSKHLVF